MLLWSLYFKVVSIGFGWPQQPLNDLAGRYFPIRSGFDLVFEAALDGKSLDTDPAPHRSTVTIENELVRLVSAVCLLLRF